MLDTASEHLVLLRVCLESTDFRRSILQLMIRHSGICSCIGVLNCSLRSLRLKIPKIPNHEVCNVGPNAQVFLAPESTKAWQRIWVVFSVDFHTFGRPKCTIM